MKHALAATVVVALVVGIEAAGTAQRQQEDRAVRHLNLEGRGDELPYSHAVLAGDTLFVAGTIGVDPETGLAPEDVEEEVRLCLDGIRAKLALADALAVRR